MNSTMFDVTSKKMGKFSVNMNGSNQKKRSHPRKHKKKKLRGSRSNSQFIEHEDKNRGGKGGRDEKEEGRGHGRMGKKDPFLEEKNLKNEGAKLKNHWRE